MFWPRFVYLAPIAEPIGVAAYLDLREIQVRRLQRAAAAARRDNVNAYQEQFRKIERGAVHRTEAAQAVGLTQCSRGS